MERWERRERKKRAEDARLPKTGMSVRLIAQILTKRAAEAKREEASSQPPSRPASRRRKRRP